MFNFISTLPLPSYHTYFLQYSPRTITRPPSLSSKSIPKPSYIVAQDRSTEFSFHSEDTPISPSNDPTQNPVDWNQWYPSTPPLNIPAFPFPPTDVFMPGELKRLHLYEARYLALFETAIVHYDKRCAHVIIDSSRLAMAASAVLLHVHSWRRLDLGVSVEVEAVGRLKVVKMKRPAPFLRGVFRCYEDKVVEAADLKTVRKLENRFWKAFRRVIAICLKLEQDPMREKTDKTSSPLEEDATKLSKQPTIAMENPLFVISIDAKKQLYEQKLQRIARRAVGLKQIDFSENVDDEMLALRATALSFAGWEFFPSTTSSRQRAIEQRDTVARLKIVCDALEVYASMLSAQLALKDAFPE